MFAFPLGSVCSLLTFYKRLTVLTLQACDMEVLLVLCTCTLTSLFLSAAEIFSWIFTSIKSIVLTWTHLDIWYQFTMEYTRNSWVNN